MQFKNLSSSSIVITVVSVAALAYVGYRVSRELKKSSS